MADSLSIPPVALSGLAGIPPVAFQLLTARASTSATSIFASSSNVVELSGTGQLLSAVSSFRTTLQGLQTNAADSSPANVAATAQGVVDAFNTLQGNTANLQIVFSALDGNALATQFVRSLNESVSGSILAGNTNLGSLRNIGIELQSTATSTTLRIDQNRLNAAVNTDPVGTQSLLTGAAQSLIDLTTGFESQVASATVSLSTLTQLGAAGSPIDLGAVLDGLQTTSSVQGIGVATDLLQSLSADTVANLLQVSDLDLAAVGLDSGTLLSNSDAIRGALVTALLSPNNAVTLLGNPSLLETVGTANPVATPATPIAGTASAAAPATPAGAAQTVAAAAVTAAANAQVAVSTLGGPATPTDAIAADRRASEATIALQALLADPSLRAIDNLSDPTYAALIAASHLSDFVAPSPAAINPKTLVPGALTPILAAPRPYGIAYYNEAAGETWKLFARRGESMKWYA